VRQDLLSHTLTVRIEPALHAELVTKAEREDTTAGESSDAACDLACKAEASGCRLALR
jgi:hypothetical protein